MVCAELIGFTVSPGTLEVPEISVYMSMKRGFYMKHIINSLVGLQGPYPRSTRGTLQNSSCWGESPSLRIGGFRS